MTNVESIRIVAPIVRKLTFFTAGLLLFVNTPSFARPGDGYGQLIDKYCIEKGRLRVPGHQNHCIMCHSAGTFDSLPQNRVEPNWSEFERARSNGNFDFFCPGPTSSDTMSSMPMPASGLPASPSGRVEPIPPEKAGALMGRAPGDAVGTRPTPSSSNSQTLAARATGRGAGQASAVPTGGRSDVIAGVASLHDSLAIRVQQEGAWRELADAVSTAALVKERPAPESLAARIKTRERFWSERLAALRGIGTALSRLDAVLDNGQKDKLAKEFPAIVDQL